MAFPPPGRRDLFAILIGVSLFFGLLVLMTMSRQNANWGFGSDWKCAFNIPPDQGGPICTKNVPRR
jgi:hypothetical protein